LTLLSTLMAEYSSGFSNQAIQDALEVPLAQAFALFATASARYGLKPDGPTYADREALTQAGIKP
jgi:hypothetical protein